MKDKFNSEDFFRAILSLETVEECKNFFDDVCTISEIQAISQRLEVAKLLRKDVVYSEIIAKTGASSATVSRVARCINYGTGGYATVLDRIEEKNS